MYTQRDIKAVSKHNPLHIEVAIVPWRKISGLKSRLEKAAALTLAALPEALQPAARRAQWTVLLTSDAAVRRLNNDFRGIDKPTNVLSFPHFTRPQLVKTNKGREVVYVGDIAIAYQYVVAEARSEHKILLNHVTHLMIHGLLHLFGYDHQANAPAVRMERLERKRMAELGLPDPYASATSLVPKAKPAHRGQRSKA